MSRLKRDKLRSRRTPIVQLTVISMMDIFTILLLFLLVHVGSEGVALPSSESLKLPISTSKILPRSTVTLMVSEQGIFIDGNKVMGIKEALNDKGSVFAPVEAELVRLGKRTKYLASQNAAVSFTGKVTVMADRKIPFHLLKKIMSTCAQAEYPGISLAVLQKEEIA